MRNDSQTNASRELFRVIKHVLQFRRTGVISRNKTAVYVSVETILFVVISVYLLVMKTLLSVLLFLAATLAARQIADSGCDSLYYKDLVAVSLIYRKLLTFDVDAICFHR